MADFEQQLADAKAVSLAQPVIRTARLLVEIGLERRKTLTGRPMPRPAHMALYPHIDLQGTRPSVLAERVGVTPQAVAQLVRDLEALGVVERLRDPDDGRARRVVFTELGREDILDGFRAYEGVQAQLEEEMGAGDFAELMRLIRKLERVVERMAEAP